jgi:hypothetical protein
LRSEGDKQCNNPELFKPPPASGRGEFVRQLLSLIQYSYAMLHRNKEIATKGLFLGFTGRNRRLF